LVSSNHGLIQTAAAHGGLAPLPQLVL